MPRLMHKEWRLVCVLPNAGSFDLFQDVFAAENLCIRTISYVRHRDIPFQGVRRSFWAWRVGVGVGVGGASPYVAIPAFGGRCSDSCIRRWVACARAE